MRQRAIQQPAGAHEQQEQLLGLGASSQTSEALQTAFADAAFRCMGWQYDHWLAAQWVQGYRCYYSLSSMQCSLAVQSLIKSLIKGYYIADSLVNVAAWCGILLQPRRRAGCCLWQSTQGKRCTQVPRLSSQVAQHVVNSSRDTREEVCTEQ